MLALARTNREPWRRLWLGISLASNLGILAYFKYADFFLESAARTLAAFGLSADIPSLEIILPVGISFYTFQTLGYTIDVYRCAIEPMRNLLTFALYVSFFPQLVAGPIERACALLPQLTSPQSPQSQDIVIGAWLVLLGYFKKVYVADNIAASIDPIFEGHDAYSSPEIWLAIVGFSLQIYGDFSGYSDIARGVARCLGFRLMVNFRLPYFALSPSDFWRRWHISLSTWLRDYLYISLGGNRGGRLATARNLMLTMLLGGLWHGASAKFVLWGGYHGALLVAYRNSRLPQALSMSGFTMRAVAWATMFAATQIGWLIFRAPTISVAWQMLISDQWVWMSGATQLAAKLIAYGGPVVLLDLWMHHTGDLLIPLKQHLVVQVILFTAMLSSIILLGFSGSTTFIYFQF